MNSLADRVSEAIKESGIDAQKVAKVCGVSVQAVYKWMNGLSKTISGVHLVELANLTQFESRWIATGKGERRPNNQNIGIKEPTSEYKVVDQVIADLAELEPEDAAVWRAQINAAAIKARKAKLEKSDRQAVAGAGDPNLEGRRTA